MVTITSRKGYLVRREEHVRVRLARLGTAASLASTTTTATATTAGRPGPPATARQRAKRVEARMRHARTFEPGGDWSDYVRNLADAAVERGDVPATQADLKSLRSNLVELALPRHGA